MDTVYYYEMTSEKATVDLLFWSSINTKYFKTKVNLSCSKFTHKLSTWDNM